MITVNEGHARWIRIRGYLSLVVASGAHLLASMGAKVKEIWRVI